MEFCATGSHRQCNVQVKHHVSHHNPHVNCKYNLHVHFGFKLLTTIIWNDPGWQNYLTSQFKINKSKFKYNVISAHDVIDGAYNFQICFPIHCNDKLC